MTIKRSLTIILSTFLLFRSFSSVFALANETQTNKFGIHILEPSELKLADELVNSSGGNWGWVTIVIRDDDRNRQKWQNFFDDCRVKHLVPIMRLATHFDNENWVKPSIDDLPGWLDFLNSLNWPVKDRYVIIFNEPNHAKEWGGQIDPSGYASILLSYSKGFKNRSSDYRLLNAGLDLAAPNGRETMEAFQFLAKMYQSNQQVFDYLDYWNSHSYPNHGYIGKPWDNKKTSIRGYVFELDYLKKLGISNDYSVFITETGWPTGDTNCRWQVIRRKKQYVCETKYYSDTAVLDMWVYAYNKVWLSDDRIIAITPFLLNYDQPLFSNFSWLYLDGSPKPQYYLVKQLPKTSWQPIQNDDYSVIKLDLPPFLVAGDNYEGKIILKNTGQKIWNEQIPQSYLSDNITSYTDLTLDINTQVIPGNLGSFSFTANISTTSSQLGLVWSGKKLGTIRILARSAISKGRLSLWYFLKSLLP